MMNQQNNTEMKRFFDSLAPHWDEGEVISEEWKRKLVFSLNIQKGDKVLDVACGTGVISGLLQEITEEKVIGIDLSSDMIERARNKYASNKNISFIEGDFLSYPFKESSFDFVIVYNAYPHFLDREGLKKAFSRVLKKGGRFAILHSLGREELECCHRGITAISRPLDTPMKESEMYQDLFEIERAEEGPHHYLIIGQKK